MEIAWIWKVGQMKNIHVHISHISAETNRMGTPPKAIYKHSKSFFGHKGKLLQQHCRK